MPSGAPFRPALSIMMNNFEYFSTNTTQLLHIEIWRRPTALVTISRVGSRYRQLSAARAHFAPAVVMHRLTTEWRTVLGRTITASRQRPTIPPAIVEIMIDVAIKPPRACIPRPRADENAPREPL